MFMESHVICSLSACWYPVFKLDCAVYSFDCGTILLNHNQPTWLNKGVPVSLDILIHKRCDFYGVLWLCFASVSYYQQVQCILYD